MVNADGIIIDSNESKYNGYDMKSTDQSNEFVEVLKVQDTFVQAYGPTGLDGSVWRKYAGINLANGGFIQVGYDAEQFHKNIEEFVIDVTKNRHVGTG